MEVAEALLAAAPELSPDDIRVTSSSVTGEDILMSTAARTRYPFVIEVKNQERLNIWEAIDQARSHLNGRSLTPLVIFRRNRSELFVALSLPDFLKLLSR